MGADGLQYLPTHVRITLVIYDERGQERTFTSSARIMMTERVAYRPVQVMRTLLAASCQPSGSGARKQRDRRERRGPAAEHLHAGAADRPLLGVHLQHQHPLHAGGQRPRRGAGPLPGPLGDLDLPGC